MDIFDRASELEQKQTKMALNNHFKKNRKMLVVSETHCIECEVEIPKARQKAIQGCQHCVDCKALIEIGER